MTTPTMHDFRALARSSPWLWRTLRFTLEFDHPQPNDHPSSARVGESSPRTTGRGAGRPADRGRLVAAGRPGHDTAVRRPGEGPDGLVARRPEDWQGPYRYDDPMFTNYRWVAMLHPFELADGVEPDDDGAQGGLWSPEFSPIDVVGLPREVDHCGRPAWEAQVVTTPCYAARCSCCPLLNGDEADRQLAAEGWDRTGVGRPTSWRIRLDRGTGVVAALTELGGQEPSTGWTMRIEAVDEEMPRELFGPDMGGGSGSVSLFGVET